MCVCVCACVCACVRSCVCVRVCVCVFTYLPCRLNDLVCQLEERERNSEAVLQSLDKEATLKQQVLELHKKKVRGWEEDVGV